MAVLGVYGGRCLAEQACAGGGSQRGQAVAVDERLDLTLEDGTKLKIAGAEPARPTPASPDLDILARDQLAKWLIGRNIEFTPLGSGRDRWGRITALVFATLGGVPETNGQALMRVGEVILDAGLARYEPNSLAGHCHSLFLAAEADARASGLGLWADPYYAIIAAGGRDSLVEKAGSLVIVEGRVTGLSVRKPRIMLYFGPRKGSDFSVTIVRRSNKEFEAAQSHLADLTGRIIRVRGLLDMRFGPQIEISDLDALEILVQEQDLVAPGPRN